MLLTSYRGVYSTALEWLIQHQSEESSLEEAAMGLQKSQSVLSPSGILTNDVNYHKLLLFNLLIFIIHLIQLTIEHC